MERDKPLLWIFYDAINEHRVAMRTDSWKILARMKSDTSYLPLIHNLHNENEALVKQADLVDFELYNMNDDIEESDNVAEQYPEQFEKMKRLVKMEYSKLLEGSYVWNREGE
jgi:arylsulfatase A